MKRGEKRPKMPQNPHRMLLSQRPTPNRTQKEKAVIRNLKPKPTREPTLLELKPTPGKPSSPTPTLMKEKLLPPTSKRTPLERAALLLLRIIRIIAVIESLLQFRIRQHLIRLIDSRHFLLRLLGGQVVSRGFVGVELLGEFAVGLFDVAVFGVAGYAEDFVVVFLLGALEQGMRFLELLLDLLLLAVVLFGGFEGPDGVFEVVGVEFAFGLVEQTGEGLRVVLQRFFAVGGCFVEFVGHLVWWLVGWGEWG